MSQITLSNPLSINYATSLAILATSFGLLGLSGCQSMSKPTPVTTTSATTPVVISTDTSTTPTRLNAFNVRGKIGIASSHPKVQSGSAYYAWAQDGDRFAMDITGALGIGHTVVEYDGVTATLTSERAGTKTANDPEVLLAEATGIQAPIAELPYWISGSHAPSDDRYEADASGRIQQAVNGRWLAEFSYDSEDPSDTLPSKIKVNYDTQNEHFYRIILTIDHTQ